jgi:tRNA (guanosine-2'-O-)-methyltransferase
MSVELIEYLSGFVRRRRLQTFENVLRLRTRYISLVCEDIYQSHNASALMRTCECFGIQDFHIIGQRNLFEVNSEVALGASNWLTVNRYNEPGNNFHSFFARLRSEGYRIVATSPHKHSISLNKLDLEKGPVSLVFGTEKEGLSAGIFEEADETVRIDMYGFTESFNVSVSAGIILHYLRMKLHKSNVKWQLSEEEKMMIKLDWLRKSVRHSELIERDFYRKKNF